MTKMTCEEYLAYEGRYEVPPCVPCLRCANCESVYVGLTDLVSVCHDDFLGRNGVVKKSLLTVFDDCPCFKRKDGNDAKSDRLI